MPAGNPVTSGTTISSSVHNITISDIATTLTQSIASDGQTVPTANLPMGAYKHTNIGNASARTDYAAAGQVQDGSFTWAGTAGGTANAITLTLSPAINAYTAGQSFTYKSGASANTGTMTVNVNNVGAKAIQKDGVALDSGDHPANKWFRITYDGAAFQLQQILQPSGFMLTVLDDATAAAARSTLGVSYGPAFRVAQSSSQALVSGANTKINLGTEEFDTNTNFATSRFTPTVEGYYQVNWLVGVTATGITNGYSMLFRNGSEHDRGDQLAASSTVTIYASRGSAVVYMDGVDDYLEVYANFTGTSLSATYSRFSGCFMRPA